MRAWLIPYAHKRTFTVNGLEGEWLTFEEACAAAEKVLRRFAKTNSLLPNQRAFIYEFDAQDEPVGTYLFAVSPNGVMVPA